MPTIQPRLFADDRGVWFETTPGRSSGIEWNDVFCVSGHKLNGITEVYTCVVLDFEYGEFIELYANWPGFDQAITAITERLPGIKTDWLQEIEQLVVGDAPVEVWHRLDLRTLMHEPCAGGVSD